MTSGASHSYATERCPFCGSARAFVDVVPNTGGNRVYIRCQDCHAQGPWSTRSIGPLELWNKRLAGPSRPDLPSALWLARWFHNTYEALAPECDYETRNDTRDFDPTSPNGKLMVAVCELLRYEINGTPATPNSVKGKDHG